MSMKRSNSYEMDVPDEREGVMEGGEERYDERGQGLW